MPSPPLARRLCATLVGVLACLGVAAPGAWAHASFLGGSPAPGQRLGASPARVVLLFSEPLNSRLSHAGLYDAASGRPLPAGQRVDHGRRLVLTPRSSLPRGAYQVRWRSVSTDDGHPLEGSFGFGVRVAAAGGRSLEQSPLARGGWARAPVRAALYAALLSFAGALLVQALAGRGRRPWLVPAALERRAGEVGVDPGAVAARAGDLVTDAGVLALGLAALAAAVEAFAAAGRFSVQALPDFLLAGPAGPARLVVIAVVAVALALARRWPRLAALASALALAAITASGHADSAQPRAVALAADFTHLLGGAVWLGGGAIMVATWWPWLRRAGSPARLAVARHVLPAFGAVALPAFAVVVVAGTVNAVVELGRPSALWQTSYGAVLLVKVALVLLAAAVSWVHVWRLRPRILAANPHPPPAVERAHWNLLRSEPALGLAVVAAAGLLVAFPLPPRQADEAAGRAVAVPACDPCPLPTPMHGELAVADLTGTQVVAAYMRRRGHGLLGTVRLLDYRGRPAVGPVRIQGATTAPCGRGCFAFALPEAGDTLRVTALEGRRPHPVTLPARWLPGQAVRARRLLERAQRMMRGLRSVREAERVTSGPGTLALTSYRLRAPDRLAWSTDGGVRSVQIGARQWLALPGQPFARRDDLDAGVAFTTASWFSWTPYAESVQLLGQSGHGRRAVSELAVMDPGTPVWIRLSIEPATGRVLREQLVARSRRVTHRFFAFDAPVTIVPPPATAQP